MAVVDQAKNNGKSTERGGGGSARGEDDRVEYSAVGLTRADLSPATRSLLGVSTVVLPGLCIDASCICVYRELQEVVLFLRYLFAFRGQSWMYVCLAVDFAIEFMLGQSSSIPFLGSPKSALARVITVGRPRS